jgi:glucose-6-phosphate isomerase
VPGLSDWIEQLIAESTGKNQIGRLPVVIADPSESAQNMVIGFSKGSFDISVEASLGEHFILWEWVTSLLCYLLKVDPFNQPNVTEAKERTAQILKSITSNEFTQTRPLLENSSYVIYSNLGISDLQDFFRLPSSYVAVMAYLSSIQDNEIKGIRKAMSKKFAKPVTFGWGPRFLHSTGQFHKGGQPNGCFIQITAELTQDLPIPSENFTFANLLIAQALGDAEALSERNLPLIRIHLKESKAGIAKLLESF